MKAVVDGRFLVKYANWVIMMTITCSTYDHLLHWHVYSNLTFQGILMNNTNWKELNDEEISPIVFECIIL